MFNTAECKFNTAEHKFNTAEHRFNTAEHRFLLGHLLFSYGLPRTFLLLLTFPAGKNGLHPYEQQTKRV